MQFCDEPDLDLFGVSEDVGAPTTTVVALHRACQPLRLCPLRGIPEQTWRDLYDAVAASVRRNPDSMSD